MKKIILVLSVFFTSISASAGIDLNSFNHINKPNTIEKYILNGAGFFTGLVIHELGHIGSIEYSGGDFVEFSEPYDQYGIPTLWMEGDKFQVGMSAMMGNNASAIMSSVILNDKIESTAFSDGVLLFSVINPIAYSLGDSAVDFETARDGLGVNIGVLKSINLIQAINIATKAYSNNKYDAYGSAILDIGVNDRYLRVSNTGRISTNQQYWNNDYGHSVNLDVGALVFDYRVKIGRHQDYDNITGISSITDYLGVSRGIKVFDGDLVVTGKTGTDIGQHLGVEVDYSSSYFFANHNSYNNESNVGVRMKF